MTQRTRAHYAQRPRTRVSVDNPTTSDLVAVVVHAATDPAVDVTFPRKWADDAPRKVWEVLRSLDYVADGPLQLIQAPHVLLDRGVGDCKSFSNFAAHMLRAAGWRVWLRFVANAPGEPVEHVYVIAQKNGQTCIVDGVWPTFDAEPPHFERFDVQV